MYSSQILSRPRTIITCLTTGDPNGIKTIEFSNRLIRATIIPRAIIKEGLARDEMGHTGVYFLVGTDESGVQRVYIGQAIHLADRMSQHSKSDKKEFWSTVVCFSTIGNKLHSADINYLENRLIETARSAKRYVVDNSTAGNRENLGEPRIADLEEYIEDIELLLSHIGFPILSSLDEPLLEEIYKVYSLKYQDCNAKGTYRPEGFVVAKGSVGRVQIQQNLIDKGWTIGERRTNLAKQGVVEERDGKIIFLENCTFKSPSGAATLIGGASLNGWTAWVDDDGKTLDENERTN